LKHYLQNKDKEAFWYQTLMFLQRIITYHKALVLQKEGKTVIIDRSLEGDRAFELANLRDGSIDKEQHRIYNLLVTGEKEQLLSPDITINLKCSLETSIRRIKKRNRPGEVEAYIKDPDYLERITAAYEEVFKDNEDNHLHVEIDWNKDLDLTKKQYHDQEGKGSSFIEQYDCLEFIKILEGMYKEYYNV
jgi:deoxyadenosine/deoxycytidine kinase